MSSVSKHRIQKGAKSIFKEASFLRFIKDRRKDETFYFRTKNNEMPVRRWNFCRTLRHPFAIVLILSLLSSRILKAASPPSFNPKENDGGSSIQKGNFPDGLKTDKNRADGSSNTNGSHPTKFSPPSLSQRKDKGQKQSRKEKRNTTFLKWCQTVLGIQTLLHIQDFEHINHLSEWQNHHYDIFDDSRSEKKSNDVGDEKDKQEIPTMQLRGLAASRNIHSGEVVISIPFHTLITIPTTIDQDPILSNVLGPEARQRYGWTTSENSNSFDDTSNMKPNGQSLGYEIPLLVVAILYHRSLGPALSPLWNYIDILISAPTDTIPFLWESKKLQEMEGRGQVTAGLKELAFGINDDLEEMYDSIMRVLIRDHVDIFGKPKDNDTSGSDSDDDRIEVEEGVVDTWMYSYEKFKWAFAIVNSRRWHLPLQDVDELLMKSLPSSITSESVDSNIENTDKILQQRGEPTNPTHNESAISPPAQQPTDNFISQQSETIKNEYSEQDTPASHDDPIDGNANQQQQQEQQFIAANINDAIPITPKHSFLAPLADMLNFGPPCTRGRYNPITKAFEVIATCPFLEGQEVTFWYSDDCDNVIIANYGFTHPMVPSCRTLEDWRERSELWRKYANDLERELEQVLDELDMVRNACDCENRENDDNGFRETKEQIEQVKKEAKPDDALSTSHESERHDAIIANQRRDEKVGGIRRMRQQYIEDLGL